MSCEWCGHPKALHSGYDGGWCSANVMVVDHGDLPPYNVSCWCGGTEEAAGPRIVLRGRSTTRLVRAEGGWRYP